MQERMKTLTLGMTTAFLGGRKLCVEFSQVSIPLVVEDRLEGVGLS